MSCPGDMCPSPGAAPSSGTHCGAAGTEPAAGLSSVARAGITLRRAQPLPRHPRPPYLVQGFVGVRVSVQKGGFFPELLPEGLLLDLQGTQRLGGAGAMGLVAQGEHRGVPEQLQARPHPFPRPARAPRIAGISCG